MSCGISYSHKLIRSSESRLSPAHQLGLYRMDRMHKVVNIGTVSSKDPAACLIRLTLVVVGGMVEVNGINSLLFTPRMHTPESNCNRRCNTLRYLVRYHER